MTGALILIALLLLTPINAVAVNIYVYVDGHPVDATLEIQGNATTTWIMVTNGSATTSIEPGNYTAYVYFNGTVHVFNITVDENTTDIYLNITMNQTVDTPISSYNYGWLGLNMVLILVILIIVGLAVAASRLPRRL